MIKEKYRDIDGNLIESSDYVTNLDILDTFIQTYESAKREDKYDKNPYLNGNSSESISYPEITGIVYVHNSADNKYAETDIINKYQAYFPKLTFFFKNVANSYRAIYVTKDEDGTEKIVFTESKPENTDNLHLTYPSGYDPSKINCDFMGWSRNPDATPESEEVYHENYTDNFEEKWSQIVFTSTEKIIKFYAIFVPTTFIASFYNVAPDGTPSEKPLLEMPVEAGTHLSTPDLLPVTDESNLADTERYKLLGWVSDPKYSYPASKGEGLNNIVALENIISENVDRVFYACYIKESVYDSETDHRYFNFTSGGYRDSDNYFDANYTINEGYICVPKAEAQLSGKITVPGTYNNKPVIEFGGLNGNANITHIYFKNPEKMRKLGNCGRCANLKVVDWPSGLRSLGSTSFNFCPKLKFNAEAFAATSLAYIGTQCFTGSFDVSTGGIPLIALPGTIKEIAGSAFGRINSTELPSGNFLIEEVRFGGPGDPCSFNFDSLAVNANIFVQNSLKTAPTYPNATINTPIKKFTYYKDSSNDSLTIDTFKEYIESSKVNGENDILEIGVEG